MMGVKVLNHDDVNRALRDNELFGLEFEIRILEINWGDHRWHVFVGKKELAQFHNKEHAVLFADVLGAK